MGMTSQTALGRAASYGQSYRQSARPLHAAASVAELRRALRTALPEKPTDGASVIDALITAAEPGLIGNTDPNFFAWVMGGSDPVGVAADWLTSIWGQNAGIFQTAPAAAIAEEAVADWLLDLLELPRESSVGFVTGATMAAFTCLAAARGEVLARAGHDFDALGLQGAPQVTILLSEDAHATNLAALRYLGFGTRNLLRLPADAAGLMAPEDLARALAGTPGPKIVIAQAGHINSGGFEDFARISALARAHGAWLHVDGAFGLWARVLPEKAALTAAVDAADSWSVDGHKWLQIPYDSGFAIVRHPEAHQRAMDITAGYLNSTPEDGRNPTGFNPELSRRARGFAAWAVLRSLGVQGVQALIRGHCEAAAVLARDLQDLPGLRLANRVEINQVTLEADRKAAPSLPPDALERLCDRLNRDHGVFVRTAQWRGRTVLRFSVISPGTDTAHCQRLARSVRTAWTAVAAGAIRAAESTGPGG